MIRKITLALGILCVLLTVQCLAFGQQSGGCGAGKCSDCHSLNEQEASKLIKGIDRVLKVEFAEVPGMWVVEVEKGGNKFPLYIDFSKAYLFAGNVIRLADGQDMTQQRLNKLSGGQNPAAKPAAQPPTKIDFSRIPLADAVVLGKADAPIKVAVFTDPECPYCKKLHEELKEVVKLDPSIAFFIKLFPLVKLHPNAYGISKTIVCSTNPASLLDASMSGVPIAQSACPTTRIDDNIALAGKLGIGSTPTLVLPDGTIMPGYKKAPDLLKLLGSKVTPPASKQQ